MNRTVAATLGLVLLLGIALNSAPQLSGQEPKPKAEAKAKAKPKGRLPAYYKDVVSEDQKAKIYAIQGKYADEIAALAEQMKAAVAKRDAEVEGVLTAEQRTKVEELKAAAAKKNAADPKEPAVEAKPATTTAKP